MPEELFTPSDDEMARIHKEIWKIESENNVKVLFAVESGSRSWGMASKNSDYDVRFVYKRPIYDYLRLDQRKDTIDWHPDQVLDMVGWDVSKYLSLLHRSNPSALEWLDCPRYVVSDPFKLHAIEELSDTCFRARSLAFHYIGMAKENANEFLRIANGVTRDEPPKTKKYLYVIRALLSARHVIDNGEMPYILLDDLVDEYLQEVEPLDVCEAVDELLERKRDGLETDTHERIPVLDEWVKSNIVELESMAQGLESSPAPDWDDVNELFIRIITT